MDDKIKLLAADLSFYEDVPTSAEVPFGAYASEEGDDLFALLRKSVINLYNDHAPATEASFAQWGSALHAKGQEMREAIEQEDTERALEIADLMQRNIHAFTDCMAILADDKDRLHFAAATDVIKALAGHLQEQGI